MLAISVFSAVEGCTTDGNSNNAAPKNLAAACRTCVGIFDNFMVHPFFT
jgi:hypothetical protein